MKLNSPAQITNNINTDKQNLPMQISILELEMNVDSVQFNV